MVTISRESAASTEARLRRVFRMSTLEWLPGLWGYFEPDESSDNRDWIAVIRDGARLSALRPSDATTSERFGVVRVVLPPGEDDSGFVGWLASRVKGSTGSGLFVICGYNRARGGVFDYYGVPEAAISSVRILLERLDATDTLDGVVMGVVESAPNASIDTGTVFCFDQDGAAIKARYGGGTIAEGWLVGTVDAHTASASFRYLQVGTGGTVDCGQSEGRVERLPDGRWSLTETSDGIRERATV